MKSVFALPVGAWGVSAETDCGGWRSVEGEDQGGVEEEENEWWGGGHREGVVYSNRGDLDD